MKNLNCVNKQFCKENSADTNVYADETSSTVQEISNGSAPKMLNSYDFSSSKTYNPEECASSYQCHKVNNVFDDVDIELVRSDYLFEEGDGICKVTSETLFADHKDIDYHLVTSVKIEQDVEEGSSSENGINVKSVKIEQDVEGSNRENYISVQNLDKPVFKINDVCTSNDRPGSETNKMCPKIKEETDIYEEVSIINESIISIELHPVSCKRESLQDIDMRVSVETKNVFLPHKPLKATETVQREMETNLQLQNEVQTLNGTLKSDIKIKLETDSRDTTMKRYRPSGAQQRKKKKSKAAEEQSLAGSMLKFVKPSTSSSTFDDEISSKSDSEIIILEKSGSIHSCEETEELKVVEVEESKINVDGDEGKGVDETKQSGSDENGQDIEKPDEEIAVKKYEGSTNSSNNIFLNTDVSDWPFPVPDKLRVDIINKGSEAFQNKKGPFVGSSRTGDKLKGTVRQFNPDWFYINQPNGEKVERSWMVYSIQQQSLYCFCCRLFGNSNSKSNFVTGTGFQKWWKLNPKVHNHETSHEHEVSYQKWKTLKARLNTNTHQTVDQATQQATTNEKSKWREILKRLLDVTLFLAKQNLSFRGHREDITAENRGNFLELIKLLSRYDPVLREHWLKLEQAKTQSNKVLTSYLSPTTQNEFISLLGKMVRERILSDIKSAKYFSIIFDSTPDASYIDQMSEIIRYVHIDNKKVEVRESFLGYFQLTGKKAVDITNDILKVIENDGLDMTLCRGQGYDNAATMAGINSGVQARICERHPEAVFVPCANHSLNLCGVHSFATVHSCVTFFGTLESVYVFFSSSSQRWAVLLANVEGTVKRLVETRWSAHYEAVKCVFNSFKNIVDAIEELCDPSQTVETRGAAQNLLPSVCDFSFLCYLHLWNNVLEEVNLVQKYLQTLGLSFDKTAMRMRSLKNFLSDNRNSLVEESLEFARNMCGEMDIPTVKRRNIRRKKRMPGETAEDEALPLEQVMKMAMLECVDRFIQEIERRSQDMDKISDIFGILASENLIQSSEDVLPSLAENLVDKYNEISKEDILKEIPRFRRLLKEAQVPDEVSLDWSALQLLQFIVDYELSDSLPNVILALRFFLTLCVSVASCERSFSKLKLIKNYLRSTMSQSRLSSLAILSIENNVAEQVDFDEAISLFAENKVRKMNFF